MGFERTGGFMKWDEVRQLTEKEKKIAIRHRISKHGHDCIEHLFYDGGVSRCSQCDMAYGLIMREAYDLIGIKYPK
jgi:hypothetical protein